MAEIDDLCGAVVLDGLNDAIIGTCRTEKGDTVLAYSSDKIIAALMENDDMTLDEATEFYCFNIETASGYGDRAPIVIDPASGQSLEWQTSTNASSKL
jgi:hypothetical protein